MPTQNLSKRISMYGSQFQGGLQYALHYRFKGDNLQADVASLFLPIFSTIHPYLCAHINIIFPERLVDYISFHVPEWTSAHASNCVCILRGVIDESDDTRNRYTTVEALLLSVSKDLNCVDLSLYKERQIVLLFNETTAASDSSGNALLMMIRTSDLPFVPLSGSISLNFWNLDQLQDCILPLQTESAKVRSIPHNVIPPLAVSSSRGVGCVFAARKRALVYILEEDEEEEEEEASDMD